MTKKEKILLKKAIRLIHPPDDTEGDYHAGMDILAKLAGIPVPKLGELKVIQLKDIPVGEFKVKKMANKQRHPYRCDMCGEFSEVGELNNDGEFLCIVCLIKIDDGYEIDREHG